MRVVQLRCDHAERRCSVRRWTRKLPRRLRAVHLALGLSNQEVAELLDLSVAAAKSRIHRARMKIRHELELWLRDRDAP
jgi:DNA-directed RNA polymerase specialized sigma24 family protein